VARYRQAVEALAAVVQQVADDSSASDTPQQIFEALIDDLADGQIDGENSGVPVAALAALDTPIDTTLAGLDLNALTIPGTTMPAWGEAYGGRLSDQQLDDVAAYVAGWPQEMGAARSRPAAGPERTPPAGLALLLFIALAAGGAVLLRLLDGAGSRSPDDLRRE
jgi:hypothetical protein